MDENKFFYLKISLILAAAFFVWFFGSPKDKLLVSKEISQEKQLNAPAALTNFAPPMLMIFGDSENMTPRRDWTVPFLEIMLIDSSNDAALAFANHKPGFISLMNQKAKELGLNNTRFSNADGLDDANNHSSALDVSKIFSYLVSKHPEALEIMKINNMVVYSSDGKITHRLQNTNELLEKTDIVIAGKTGYTEKAGGSLVLLAKGDIITVVLGSPDRFGESEKLINWLKSAYIWEK